MKTSNSEKYRSLAAGITKRLASQSSITMANAAVIPTDLAKLFTSVADALDAAPPLRVAWLSSARSAKAAETKAHPTMVAFVEWIRATYGKEPSIMEDFGLPAPAPRPAKASTKAQAQVKAKATRASKKGTTAVPAAATPASSTPAPKG